MGRKGTHDYAMADYMVAIQLKPDFALAYHNRGVAYEKQGDHDCAAVDYAKRENWDMASDLPSGVL